jgi:hypothetical protein
MKALLPLSVAAALIASPAFCKCVAPLNDVKIPNGNKATMDEMVTVNRAMQENTTEVETYLHCLKAEQAARVEAMGPDITEDQRAKIASEYVNRQNAELEKLQRLAARYDETERSFRAKQATEQATEEANAQAAAVNAAEQDAAAKSRREAAAQKSGRAEKTPVSLSPNPR